MKVIFQLVPLLAAALHVSAHGVITAVSGTNGVTGAGFGVVATTPRDGSRRNPFQQDSSIIRDKEISSGKADVCGRTLGGGVNNVQTMLAAASTAGLPTAAPDGSVQMTLHQVNGDGAGPYTCQVSADATGQNFVAMTVTTQVPGKNSRSNAKATDFPLVAQMPAGMTCTGGPNGDACLVRCRNAATAGPFGGCVAVTTADSANVAPAAAAGTATGVAATGAAAGSNVANGAGVVAANGANGVAAAAAPAGAALGNAGTAVAGTGAAAGAAGNAVAGAAGTAAAGLSGTAAGGAAGGVAGTAGSAVAGLPGVASSGNGGAAIAGDGGITTGSGSANGGAAVSGAGATGSATQAGATSGRTFANAQAGKAGFARAISRTQKKVVQAEETAIPDVSLEEADAALAKDLDRRERVGRSRIVGRQIL
ncbi:hypothetical protein PC9H_000059 [Pleurotus ostreatus]|uniref:GEgh 16 protein n=1 Tax=Pleurotus ostreatus TaxID=5322 RepID=A0A8H7A0E9_PLEOS|nr:uncharacterized protein PC9H_000059 [Pleurotus ostreatus]KAF7439723.1 hypothetical protein PC9H_000059 [Pleurotus ostreatus]KAJ8701120.1 hypothetical protein PTI98_004077 [Pleurotus ostreatus]